LPHAVRINLDITDLDAVVSPELRGLPYLLAFLQNDAAGMAQQVAWAADKPGAEDVLLWLEADCASRKPRNF
jgi:hypothetical protein